MFSPPLPCPSLWVQAISPTKRPAVSKTPTGREGQVVGGVSPAYKTFPTKEASPYTVVDCESSVTALEMVQLPLDKQGIVHCT